MPPRGFRKVADGVYRADRVVRMPKRNPLTGGLYEAAFRAVIRRIAGDGWRLALEHVSDESDHITPSEYESLQLAAEAADKAGWT